MRVLVSGLGIVAPGMTDWSGAAAVLRGEQTCESGALTVPAPTGLTLNERRRATLATKLALEAARQATTRVDPAHSELASVFASSDGDMTLIDRMCRSIYEHGEPPSPTVFQNSVHNAVSGYWSIAGGCRTGSTSVAAGDGSFAAGLLEAATKVTCTGAPTLLVTFDVPAPELLHPHRPFTCAFACALLLAPEASGDEGTALTLILDEKVATMPETPMRDQALETMRTGNPAARSLPLLTAIAGTLATRVILPYWPDLRLGVDVEPTS